MVIDCKGKCVYGSDHALQKIKVERPFRCSIKFNISSGLIPSLFLVRLANDHPECLICEVNSEHRAHLDKYHVGWCGALNDDRIVLWSRVTPPW